MTRNTVVWNADVEASFIRNWVAADSNTRAALTEIANWVDANLAEHPESKGRPRPDLGTRIVAVPLSNSTARVSATYTVSQDDRQVRDIRLLFRG